MKLTTTESRLALTEQTANAVSLLIRRKAQRAPSRHWNTWIEHRPLRVYLRLGPRRLCDKWYQTLDIVNIQVEQYAQNTGIFGRLLDKLEATPLWDALYVENVIGTTNRNQLRICKFLERRGFLYVDNSQISTLPLPPSMYKILSTRIA